MNQHIYISIFLSWGRWKSSLYFEVEYLIEIWQCSNITREAEQKIDWDPNLDVWKRYILASMSGQLRARARKFGSMSPVGMCGPRFGLQFSKLCVCDLHSFPELSQHWIIWWKTTAQEYIAVRGSVENVHTLEAKQTLFRNYSIVHGLELLHKGKDYREQSGIRVAPLPASRSSLFEGEHSSGGKDVPSATTLSLRGSSPINGTVRHIFTLKPSSMHPSGRSESVFAKHIFIHQQTYPLAKIVPRLPTKTSSKSWHQDWVSQHFHQQLRGVCHQLQHPLTALKITSTSKIWLTLSPCTYHMNWIDKLDDRLMRHATVTAQATETANYLQVEWV